MGMALITIHAIPDIIIVATMFWIGLSLCVTNGALEDRVIRGIRMASCAYTVGAAVIHGEKIMCECCSEPTRGGVAGRTGCREACGNVIRIGCSLVNRFMAAVTIHWQRFEIIVHMATCASNRRVETSQWEGRSVVIKHCSQPRRCGMASFTSLRESCLHMVRGRCGLIFRQVAGHTRSDR